MMLFQYTSFSLFLNRLGGGDQLRQTEEGKEKADSVQIMVYSLEAWSLNPPQRISTVRIIYQRTRFLAAALAPT